MHLERVTATPAALSLLEELQAEHGPLMFHQSGGCCDGSSPMCYPRGEFRVGSRDVHLGLVGGDTPFYISGPQFAYWKHTTSRSTSCPAGAVASPSRRRAGCGS